MPYTTIDGQGLWLPSIPHEIDLAPSYNFVNIDATGEKMSYQGRVWFAEGTGTKDIARVGFRFGTTSFTKAGGSGLTVSLQDFATTGPPGIPDETQDQTVSISNGDSEFAAGSWIRTGALSSNRTVSFGERLCIVIEFDGSGRQGSDVIVFSGTNLGASGGTSRRNLINSISTKASGSWVATSLTSAVAILEFSDGTFGVLEGCPPYKDLNSHTYNSATGTADEYALAFQVPIDCKVDALWAMVSCGASTADFDLVLYQGTTQLAAASMDANQIVATGTPLIFKAPIDTQTLTAGTQYYVAVKPTTTNNLTAYSWDVYNANHFRATSGGVNFNYSTRLDSGSWASITTTRRLFAGIRISAVSSSSGGGLIGGGQMNGGLV